MSSIGPDPASSAAPARTRRQDRGLSRAASLALLALAAALIAARAPGLLLEPRFWAEEGSVYFRHAHLHPGPSALFAVHQGYLSLAANLAALCAALVPLEQAPLVTTLFAGIIQLVPIAIVLLAPSQLWRGLRQRVPFALVPVFGWASGEVWLNMANAQFQLALAGFLLLLLDDAALTRRARRAMLVLAALIPLSSPSAVFLCPTFAALALWERSAFRRWCLGLFGGASLIQVAVVLAQLGGATAVERAAQVASAEQFSRFVLVNTVLKSFFSATRAWSMVESLPLPATLALLGVLLLGLRLGHKAALIFTTAALLMSVLSLRFGVKLEPAPRYFHVASSVVLFLVVANATRAPRPPLALDVPATLLALGLLLAWLMQQVPSYRRSFQSYYDASWPSWRAEVRLHRADPAYRPRVWPADGERRWEVDLGAP